MGRRPARRYSAHYNFPLNIQKKGSILLEVMLAVFILSIAMVTIIGNFIQSSALASETAYHLRLSTLLHTKLEQLSKQDMIYEQMREGYFPEPYENCSYRIHIIEEERRYSHSDFPVMDLPNVHPMYRIEISIFIPVGNRTYEYNTHTYFNHIDFLAQPPYILRFRLDDN